MKVIPRVIGVRIGLLFNQICLKYAKFNQIEVKF